MSDELNYIKEVFCENDYPIGLVEKVIYSTGTPSNSEPKNTPHAEEKKLFIPFITNFSYKLQHKAKQMNVQTIFTKSNSLRDYFVQVKSKSKPRKRIYSQPCAICGKNYIGETGRLLSTRLKEHQSAVRLSPDRSAIATHINDLAHAIDWSACRVLDKENNIIKRKILYR